MSTPSKTELSAHPLVADFERDGFVALHGFFKDPEMQRLDRLIQAHFGDNPDFGHNDEFLRRSRTDVVPWFPQDEGVQAFDRIDDDRRLQALTEAILGDGWISHYCMVMFSKLGSQGQAWHQDCAPDRQDAFNLNRLVYTRDITPATGGEVVIVPGSHRRGLLPAGDPSGEFEGQQELRPTRGTLLLIHGHAWHRVLPVRSGPRYSVNYRAAPAATPADITDVCVYRNMRYKFSTAEVIEERGAH